MSSAAAIPALGSHFEFTPYRGARRVYQLVEIALEGTPATAERAACERFRLRVVLETGFIASACYGVGWEMFVEEDWFVYRTDARRVAA